MKHIIKTLIILTFFVVIASVCYAEQDIRPKDMNFTPLGEGKYIYSNNPEFITRDLLCDYSNPNPTFLMSNEDMGADKYAMFISHVNHTKILKNSTTIKEKGFEIELDVQFKAKEDTKITFSAIGFEVPENRYYYENGFRHTFEEPWGCLNAWASYLHTPICQIESGIKYVPKSFTPITVTIKKDEVFWLSSIIENYRSVPFFRAVHMLADFEITEGVCDINIGALKSNGTFGDRNQFNPKATYSKYIKDRQYKGVADTLNEVSVDLNYTVDATVYNNTKLPVMVHNQNAPNEGNYTQTWVTHINPKANISEKYHVVESDMLQFKYIDDNKLSYYGSNVPESKKNNVWVFDTKHSDSDKYPGKSSGYSKQNYIPNYEIPKSTVDYTTCNLGNYGVKTKYNLHVKNDGWSTRYFNYILTCDANVIVMLKNADGSMRLPYALCKGATEKTEDDVILSIPLMAQQTNDFIIEVILPTNYCGAIMNSFNIVNTETNIPIFDDTRDIFNITSQFTGSEYIKWQNGELYTTKDFENYELKPLNAQTKNIFDGSRYEFEFVKTNYGYMAKPSLYDATPYALAEDFYKTVYFLDNNFNLVSSHKFSYYPKNMSYANGIYYVYAGSPYQSSDKENWYLCNSNDPFPIDNFEGFPLKFTNGNLSVFLFDEYTEIKTESLTIPNAQPLGDTYYFVRGKKLFTSKNGVYWKDYNLTEKAETINRVRNQIIVNDKQKIEIENKEAPIVIANNKALGFDICPEISSDGMLMVPMRFLLENLDIKVSWNESEGSCEVSGITIKPWTNTIGTKSFATPIYIKDGMTMVPLRVICEELGFDVSFYGDKNIIEIQGEKNV